ncbi:hypothetical protein DPMN_100419 [Dreissena polymorpha]|uniref:Uncharacterized protein n=1 Tax=Dreissena polymorpha TaxID=45954 RepID=A0A9D4R7F5_DREPO|nr:hypothetical protein DPMN_100419 [Dreissena polymorpha]
MDGRVVCALDFSPEVSDKAVGKKKLIGDLNELGERLQRKKWRQRQNPARKRSAEINAQCLQTPASSTDHHNVASTYTDTGSKRRKSLSKLKYKQTVELSHMQRQLDTAQKKTEMNRKRRERERSKKVSVEKKKSIQDFYERDDVSRIVNCYKNTVTQQKYKHQKSDGPSSQYRQKVNFFPFQSEIYEHEFEAATWIFHEAGHGKGIPGVYVEL